MKEFTQEEKSDLIAKEPEICYEPINRTVDTTEDLYNALKAEADTKFGKKDVMSVEEYFGKLRFMVNGYYEKLQGKD